MLTIFRTIYGSRLYGTDNESSDYDVKSVYLPTPEEMLFNTGRLAPVHTEYIKNGVKYDCENIPLQVFFKLAAEGQTMAYDMLFAPEDMWLKEAGEDFSFWKEILKNRNLFITKKCLNFVSYSIGQAIKYSKKGESLNELRKAISCLSTVRDFHAPIRKAIQEYPDSFRFKYELKDAQNNERYIVIQNMTFPVGAAVKTVVEGLESKIAKYGMRAQAAADSDGKDLKALSHALRALAEAEELADTGEIIFPLKKAEEIKAVKYGHTDKNTDELAEYLLSEAKRIDAKIKDSKLPEDASDYTDLIVKAYEQIYGTCLYNSVESQVTAMVEGYKPVISDALICFADLQEKLDTENGEDVWEKCTEPLSKDEIKDFKEYLERG